MKYCISRENGTEFLQGIEANEHYVQNSRAPTMGVCHGYSEFKTVWGNDPVTFERLTAANYIKIIMEEFRWGDATPCSVQIEPVKEGQYDE